MENISPSLFELALPFRSPNIFVFLPTLIYTFIISEKVALKQFSIHQQRTNMAHEEIAGLLSKLISTSFIGIFLANITIFQVTDTLSYVAFFAGILLMLLGSLLRCHCIKMLGVYFTYYLNYAPQQPVIQSGAYKSLRHPSYTAGILMYLGLGLALANWLSIVIIFIGTAYAYLKRIKREEELLIRHQGQAYLDYMMSTKRLVPWLY